MGKGMKAGKKKKAWRRSKYAETTCADAEGAAADGRGPD